MRESEAAHYLGVTPQTLYRYRKAGTLPYRETKGKTRPYIEYDPDDLNRLKADLDQRRTRSAKPAPLSPSRPRVTFGLPEPEYQELATEAKRYGMSPGEYARRLVREGLESRFQAEAAELRAHVGEVTRELKQVRAEFATGFEAVLEFVGLPPEQAHEWVTENLR